MRFANWLSTARVKTKPSQDMRSQIGQAARDNGSCRLAVLSRRAVVGLDDVNQTLDIDPERGGWIRCCPRISLNAYRCEEVSHSSTSCACLFGGKTGYQT
jgi:hypothetical protein